MPESPCVATMTRSASRDRATAVSTTAGCPSASFESARKTEEGSRGATDIWSGDFDADGKLDLAFIYDRQAYLMMGRGDGFFESPKLMPPVLALVRDVGDFNGDGRSDIIVAENVLPPVTILLLTRADGTFDRQAVGVDLATGLVEFLRPDFLIRDLDLRSQIALTQEETDAYNVRRGTAFTGVIRRFDPILTGGVGAILLAVSGYIVTRPSA